MAEQGPRIGHLILAHTDPEHIVRLAKKLAAFSQVYLHIEAAVPLEPFARPLRGVPGVRFITPRLHCRWGGWNAVEATLAMMQAALEDDCDRLVFLQGADYPLYSPGELQAFFAAHPDTEFIRGCNVSQSQDPYFKEMCRVIFFRNQEDLPHKLLEKLFQHGRIYLRRGTIPCGDGRELDAFWGSAQWALTGSCARYVMRFHREHPAFDRWFWNAFPTDELYFATVVMNSPFAARTSRGGPEPAKPGLVNWRNLHYFEYPGSIRVFRAEDWDLLQSLQEPYLRKVNTAESTPLLDRLDREQERRDKNKENTAP